MRDGCYEKRGLGSTAVVAATRTRTTWRKATPMKIIIEAEAAGWIAEGMRRRIAQ